MVKTPEYGLLIDYEYCTGCYTCQVACAQEYQWPAGMAGIQIIEVVQKLPQDKAFKRIYMHGLWSMYRSMSNLYPELL